MPNYITRPRKRTLEKGVDRLTAGKGVVFYQDGFEGTLRMTGGAIDATAGAVLDGTNTLKITSDTGGSPWNTTSIIRLPLIKEMADSIIAYEISFRPNKVNTTEIANFYLTLNIGPNQFGWQWVPVTATTGKLQYKNSSNVMTDITGGGFNLTANKWYKVKLYADLVNKKYVGIQFGDQYVSLAGLGFRTITDSKTVEVTFNITGIDATAAYWNFDNFVITHSEP